MAEETQTAESGGKSRILVVIVAFQLIITATLGYLVFTMKEDITSLMAGSATSQKEDMDLAKDNEELTLEEKEEKGMGPLVDLGSQMVINIRGSDGRNHFLRTSLSIEVDSEETRREVESKIVVIRYSLQRLLSSRRPEEVIGAEQMELVRNAMKRTADAVLASKKGKVINVWPNEWILE